MLGQLIPCGGGDPIPLLRNKLLVGRRSRCDITLKFPNISSHHCELELINGYWRVKDLGSTNGIKVNEERCDTRWLMPGDVLRIAKHSYEIAYEPLGEAPPPDSDDVDIMAEGLLEKAGLVQRRDDRRDSSSAEVRRPPVPKAPLRPSQRPTPPAPEPPAKRNVEEDDAFAFLMDDEKPPRPTPDPSTDDS